MPFVSTIATIPVQADEWGQQDTSTGAHPDENPHTTCFGSNFPIVGVRDEWVRDIEVNALDGLTDANVNHHNLDCTLSGTSETDVVWEGGNLTGAYGQAPCNDYETFSNQCDQYYVTLDFPAIEAGSEDEIMVKIISCHELGHTVGLSHRSGLNCMFSPSTASPPGQIGYRRFDTGHHIPDHINPWF